MTIDISLENSGAYALGFSAAGIVDYLRGDGFLYQSQHVNIMCDFLSSAYKGLEEYCDQPNSKEFSKDLQNFTVLLKAYLDSKNMDSVGKWFFHINELLTDLNSLKASKELSEDKKKELISLCDAVNRYAYSITNPNPVT